MSELVLWRRLTNRLNLEQRLVQVQATLGKIIVPTVSVDTLLKLPTGQFQNSTATSDTHVYVVPAGRRWTLKYLSSARALSGTIELIIRPTAFTGAVVMVYGLTALTYLKSAGWTITVDEGGTVEFLFGTGTSGLLRSSILYDEEII